MGAYEKALLKDKFGWKGEKYRGLIGKIISENYQKISNSVLTTDKRRFAKDVQNILPKRDEKKAVIPDVSNIIRRSPTIRKAADRGKLLEVSMREELRKIVKRGLLSQNVTTTTGTVRKNISKAIEKEMNNYFEGYTKKHPKYGMPKNIHAIAVTESRSVINQIRNEYLNKALADNPEIEAIKIWKHNDSMSITARFGHKKIDGQKRKFNEPFDIPIYKIIKGRPVFIKTIQADHPHDKRLPAEEVITCNCEAVYKFVKK
jgi:hypothetical protein